MNQRLPGRGRVAVAAALHCAAVACDGTGSEAPENDAAQNQASPGQLYALQTFFYQTDDTPLSYVAFSDSLKIDDVALSEALEFPGYAFISEVSGHLLLSSGESPTITRYAVSASHKWTKEREISFANLGVPSYGAGFERHWFVDEHTAYLTHEVTSRIVWDPTEMEILGVEDDTQLDRERDGLVLDATFNRPPLMPMGRVFKSFYYRDEDWYRFGAVTPIASYDPTTHEEADIVLVPCPALEVMSQDEDGNTYFSPWTYGPALGLFGEGPETCIRRLTPDGKLDTEWTPQLSEWTAGRPVQVLRYVADGKAIGTVLHVDEVDGDFSKGYDEDLASALDEHWRLWLFDLEKESAQLIDEIGNCSMGFNMSLIDGHSFVFVPDAGWTETTVYEIDSKGKATKRFDVDGVVNNWIKLR